MCVCTLQLSLYGIVALHVNTLVCVRQQRITKHDIVAPTGVAERALLCLGRAGCFGSNWRRCRSSMSGLLRQQLEAMQRQYGDAGQQQQQRWGGGQHYQQPQRQQQQQHAGTCWVGNTARGWYQPESSPPPGASMRGVFKCERCGALGQVGWDLTWRSNFRVWSGENGACSFPGDPRGGKGMLMDSTCFVCCASSVFLG